MSDERSVTNHFTKIGESLIKLGLVPAQKVIPLLTNLWKGSSAQKEKKEAQEALENFMKSLERIATEIEQYDDDQKKKSQLSVDVKTSLVTVYDWAALVDKGHFPQDLVKTLQKKTELLDESIQAEQLRFGRDIDKKVNLVTFFAKLNVKSPLDYYNAGKYLLKERQWLKAKDEFLAYQKFADAKRQNKLPKDLGDIQVKDPHEDKHLEYLEYIQKQIDEKINEQTDEMSLLLSKTVTTSNPYTPLKNEWRKTYPYREALPSGSSSSQGGK